jgi:hypothetical protein
VTEFERQCEQAVLNQGLEHLGVLAHELRNALNSATLAFSALQSGAVGRHSRRIVPINLSQNEPPTSTDLDGKQRFVPRRITGADAAEQNAVMGGLPPR